MGDRSVGVTVNITINGHEEKVTLAEAEILFRQLGKLFDDKSQLIPSPYPVAPGPYPNYPDVIYCSGSANSYGAFT